MIAVIGDVHRSFGILEEIMSKLPRRVTTVIQVGDLGLTANDVRMRTAQRPALRVPLGKRLYWVDGNWDDYGGLELSTRTEPTELLPSVVYVPRGTVLNLDGRRIGFIGGAESIMPEARFIGQDWWPEREGVKDADISRLLRQAAVTRGIDLLIAHTPPASATERMTGLPAHASAIRIQQAQYALDGVPVIAGHMHRSWQDEGPPSVVVLDEMEVTPL